MRNMRKKMPKFLWNVSFVIMGFAMGLAWSGTGLGSSRKAEIVSALQREVGQNMTARFIGNRLFLEGTAANDFEADRAVEIAKALLGVTAVSGRGVASQGGIGNAAAPGLIDMLRVAPRGRK